MPDKMLINALIVSAAVHAPLLVAGSPFGTGAHVPGQESPQSIYIHFEPLAKQPLKEHAQGVPAVSSQARNKDDKPAASTEINAPEIPSRDEPVVSLGKNESKDVPPVSATAKENKSDSVIVSGKGEDLSRDPEYMSYYDAVRSRLYEAVELNKPPSFFAGDVRLVFTLSRTGELVSSSIVQDRSSRDPLLRQTVLASVRRSAPFRPFYEMMSEDELTLRVTVSFRE
jgi:hypothetical protein